MKVVYALSLLVAISACASASVPTDADSAIRGQRDDARPWMSPTAKGQSLLYVSDDGTNDVDVFALPSGKRMGKLTGFQQPQGECADAAGDVFITDTEKSSIVEYAHAGTTPVKILKDAGYRPVGCSIDPSTGNLAVTNIFASNGSAGNVAIYKDASAEPAHYTDSTFYYYYFCGYDGRGNLYVDGYAPNNAVSFAELPAGSSSFINIALDQTVEVPGTVQWDGKWIAVGDQNYEGRGMSGIFEFRIKGSIGYLEFRTPLTASKDVVQAWIDHGIVYAPDAELSTVGLYHYRAGGAPFTNITGLKLPVGATASTVSIRRR